MATGQSTIKAAIVGGTGYTGVELLRLLAQHPHVALTAITSRTEAGTPVASMFPNLRGAVDLAFTTPDDAALQACDVVLFATPHGVAMDQAPGLIEKGVKVIDLAADFRLRNLDAFEHWYKMPHACPDVLQEAAYGLPELHRDAISKARVVANPGCYPTTVLLGLAPLWQQGRNYTDGSRIIADCKTGVSGAGRKASVGMLFGEASDNFRAYGLPGHRHHPEIIGQLDAHTGSAVDLTFVPHLVPMVRGMMATLYVTIADSALGTDFQALFETYYANEPFVDVMPAGSIPETRSVRGANTLRLAVHRPDNGNQLIILSAQDNLVKGASGQAVQNMNIMFGLDETAGLHQLALLP